MTETTEVRLADSLNRYFHNWVIAYMFAGWLRRHWDELRAIVEEDPGRPSSDMVQ